MGGKTDLILTTGSFTYSSNSITRSRLSAVVAVNVELSGFHADNLPLQKPAGHLCRR